FAVAAADQGGGQMLPNDALALCDVAFFQLITGSLLVEYFASQSQRLINILRVGYINEAKTHQFLFGVTQHLAEGAVGFEDPKISAAQHDADRAFLKGFAEPLLA